MSYILLSEGCKGSYIKFIEENGEFLHKPVGKNYSGTLALQTFEDRDYMRITFADGKNVFSGAIKKLFGMAKPFYDEDPSALVGAYKSVNQDYLCHFDFSEEELRSGKKKITYAMQELGWMTINVITCYDLKKKKGATYMFPNDDEAKKWARQLGINKVEILDGEGALVERKSIK